jgi:hypothetical protein
MVAAICPRFPYRPIVVQGRSRGIVDSSWLPNKWVSPIEMEFLGNGVRQPRKRSEVTSFPAAGFDRGNKPVVFQSRSVRHDRGPEWQSDEEPNLINLVIARSGGSGIAPSYPARDSAFHRGFTADVTF